MQTSATLRFAVLVALVIQTTALVICMRMSRIPSDSSSPLYLISTAVVLAEVMKFVASFAIEVSRQGMDGVMNELSHSDTLRLAIPGFLYLVQNSLLYVALSNLDAATYQVMSQVKLLTTAFFSVTMLNKVLTTGHYISLIALGLGVAVVQIDASNVASSVSGDSPAKGLIALTIACFTSGFAGVYLERIMKRGREVSLWMRNIQLSVFGVCFGMLGILASADRLMVEENGFFFGYTRLTWVVVALQALGGLIVASVIKYADNILKGFATSISIVLSSCLSAIIFETKLTSMFLFGTCFVLVAVVGYARVDGTASRSLQSESTSPSSLVPGATGVGDRA